MSGTSLSDWPSVQATNRLDSLPIELLHQICSYLFLKHDPMRGYRSGDLRYDDPMIHLAACNRTLLGAVESFSRTLLTQWQPITNFKGSMVKDPDGNVTHRGLLYAWKRRHCVFCGKSSMRKAVLCTGLGCCAKCDKAQWPDKLTKTNAKKEYHLTDEQLLPEQARIRIRHGMTETQPSLPAIRFGTYKVDGTVATMFLRADVERLAAAVHGDFQAHMAARQAKAEARKKSMAEKRATLCKHP
ncbi:hypothetical protein MBLNU459_g2873t1 [Dothideomycetes sp. NU459]